MMSTPSTSLLANENGGLQAFDSHTQPPTSPRFQTKSFLSIAAGGKPLVIPLNRDPVVYKDRPAAIFYEDKICTLAKPFSLYLVGKFTRMPKLQEVKFAFKGIDLLGAYEIKWLDYKHVIIHLSNDQDFNRIWTRQQWFIAGQKMRIFKWPLEFEAKTESPIVPVWISFPNLKAHLYEKFALLLIVKTIGKPLFVDEATTKGSRPTMARVCVKYDCRKLPIDQVWIVTQKRNTGIVTNGYAQKVEFSHMPNYWDHCCHVGHNETNCLVLGNNSKSLGSMKPQLKGQPKPILNVSKTQTREKIDEEREDKAKGIMVEDIQPATKQTDIYEKERHYSFVLSTEPASLRKHNRGGKGKGVQLSSQLRLIALGFDNDQNNAGNDQLITVRKPILRKKAKPALVNLVSVMNVEDAEVLLEQADPTTSCKRAERERYQLLNKQTMEVEGSRDDFSCSEPSTYMLNMETDSVPSNAPWLVGGDFNSIVSCDERLNGAIPHDGSVEDLSSTLLDCGLLDTGVDFFQNLLKAEQCDISRFDPSITTRIIFATDNEFFCATPSLQEDIIKRDLLEAVLDFFKGTPLPRGITFTTLVLLPKKQNASQWSEFHPISLCTVLNKIVTKLLANRLSKILSSIISENQSGFVNGRLISDNILLAQELIGKINARSRGGNVVLKLDMAKAYDRLNWDFLYLMMEHFALQKILAFLQEYEQVSGQQVNHQKSCFITANGCPLSRRQIKAHATGWENKVLSLGGRITLLRSVLSSLPMYLLQVLKPPAIVIEKIERLFNSFLWGDSNEGKMMHWAAWNKITFPSSEGGLDIRNLKNVFDAFTLKLWWRFYTCDSLWTHFLKTKYCLGQIPQYVQPKLHDSSIWKRMIGGRDVAIQNIRWKIGKGELFFWHDCWMGDQPLVISFPSFRNDMSSVHKFYKGDSWDVDKLRLFLPVNLIDEILLIPFDRTQQDVAYWTLTPNGEFSTWSAWETIRQRQSHNTLGSLIWHRSDTDIAAMWRYNFQLKQRAPPQIVYWRKPFTGEYKLNVGGSSRNGQHAASGGVLRDHTGKLIFGFSENIGTYNSLQGELRALHRGLLLCKDCHIEKLWIEMDALAVIQLIPHSQKGSHDIRYLLESIRKCLNNISYRILHIFREGNQTVDFLSNRGHNHQNLRVFTEAQGKLHGMLKLDRLNLPYVRF
ncbi:Uncharacterized protein TCM_042331 [Theobroma cacao]|uniref:Reverse transcriptase domain-containing protein n=1 Tax=Theobroma cacao TaxID=3641 RepID=A0A061FJJ2_THECC|nr:Uncharacterized protein TCM_042331 [Theobroma cacao]